MATILFAKASLAEYRVPPKGTGKGKTVSIIGPAGQGLQTSTWGMVQFTNMSRYRDKPDAIPSKTALKPQLQFHLLHCGANGEYYPIPSDDPEVRRNGELQMADLQATLAIRQHLAACLFPNRSDWNIKSSSLEDFGNHFESLVTTHADKNTIAFPFIRGEIRLVQTDPKARIPDEGPFEDLFQEKDIVVVDEDDDIITQADGITPERVHLAAPSGCLGMFIMHPAYVSANSAKVFGQWKLTAIRVKTHQSVRHLFLRTPEEELATTARREEKARRTIQRELAAAEKREQSDAANLDAFEASQVRTSDLGLEAFIRDQVLRYKRKAASAGGALAKSARRGSEEMPDEGEEDGEAEDLQAHEDGAASP